MVFQDVSDTGISSIGYGKIALFTGQFNTKVKKKPTVVLGEIVDSELYISACSFGSPGSMNDIKILDCSSIVEDIIKLPSIRL